MRVGNARVVLVAVVCLVGLVGCQTTADINGAPPADDNSLATSALPDTTGSVAALGEVPANPPELLGADPKDDLSLAKKYFRQGGFGLAERHFRKAVELHPRDAEAWVGLAASYDRLRRFDLADRAYRQAFKIIGPTPELLNNQGYSFMLRGDYRRARATLLAARSKDPQSLYIKANLELLEESRRKAKAIN